MILKIKDNIFKNLPNNINEEIYNKTNLIYKKMINKDNKPSDTLELFDNINILLEASEEDIELKNKLKTIKTLKEFTDIFNEHSIFNQLDETLEYKAAGKGGTPDTAILIKTNKGFKIKFSAASHVADANYEGLQLFRHPMKLQLSLAKALKIFKKEGNDNPTIIELTEKINSLYKEKKEIINDNSIENIDSDIDLLDYINNTDEKLLFPDIDINGSYSNRDFIYLKNTGKQSNIIKLIKEKYMGIEKDIIGKSNWLFIVAQLSDLYEIVKTSTEYTSIEKENINKKITVAIDILLEKITYSISSKEAKNSNNSSVNGLYKEVFNGKINNEEGINNLLDFIIKYSNNSQGEAVLNNKKTIKIFTTASNYILNKYENNTIILEKIIKISKITKKTSSKLLKIEEVKKNELDEKRIKKHSEANNVMMELGNIHSKNSQDKSEIIKELKENRLTDLLKNGALKYAPKNFTQELFDTIEKEGLNHIHFLKAMEQLGELPDEVEEKEDLNKLVEIFKEIDNILIIQIDNSLVKNIMSDLLLNSFKDGILDYEIFVDRLVEEITDLYNKEESKPAQAILSNNLNKVLSLNNDKQTLYKNIIERVKKLAKEYKISKENNKKEKKKVTSSKPVGKK
jgi:hypothetical protein